MSQDPDSEKDAALRVSLSLFPVHDRTIRHFADETHRTYSNAVQFIIEDWVRLKRLGLCEAESEAA